MLRRLAASTAGLLVLVSPLAATADGARPAGLDDTPPGLVEAPPPPSASARTQAHAVDVFGSMQFEGPQSNYTGSSLIAASGVQVGLGYRVTRGFSIDGMLSSWSARNTKLVRGAVDGRGHFVRTETVDLWAGGELGVGVTSTTSTGCFDGCGDTSPITLPLLGGGMGIDLLADYVSIGADARSLVGIVGIGQSEPVPIFVFGLTLGVHLPTE